MSLGELRPETGLRGLYHLNGNSGDSSGNGYNGTDTNITYSSANGKFGQGVGTSTGNAGISLQTALVGTLGTGDFTFNGWFYLGNPGAGNYPQLFASFRTAEPYQGPTIFYDPLNVNGAGDAFLVRVTSTNTQAVTSPSASSLYGGWHMLTFLRTSGVCKFYIDKNECKSFNDTTNIAASENVYVCGRNTSSAQSLPTSIKGDECAFFNVAKSASWVRQQYSIGKWGEM